MGEDSRRQRLLIKALILVGARLALAYERETDQSPLELIRTRVFSGHNE